MGDGPDRTPPRAAGEAGDLQHERVMEAVARLAGNVAHDLNNLLTAILGHGQLLAESLPANSQNRDSADEIVAAGQRAVAMTRRLSASGRRTAPRVRVLDLADVLRAMMPLIAGAMGDTHRIETRFPAGTFPVLADRGEIEQILLALVTNARDAMPGGGTLVLALDGSAAGEGGEGTPPRVWLRVTDEGAGFTDDALEHLFEPFFTTRERGRGLGLGLALARATMTRAGGDIRVQSDPGRGATVTLSFPRAVAGTEPDALAPFRPTPASD